MTSFRWLNIYDSLQGVKLYATVCTYRKYLCTNNRNWCTFVHTINCDFENFFISEGLTQFGSWYYELALANTQILNLRKVAWLPFVWRYWNSEQVVKFTLDFFIWPWCLTNALFSWFSYKTGEFQSHYQFS